MVNKIRYSGYCWVRLSAVFLAFGSWAVCFNCFAQETPVWQCDQYSILRNGVMQGSYQAKVLSPSEITSTYPQSSKPENTIASHWSLSKDISALPQYRSEYLLSDALYNLSLEEMQKAIEPDSTFRTGARWAGVWTRDISYSIILSMAILQPQVAKISLLKKVGHRRIIQDTGTGGSYPVSTDRIVWAIAAWEIYKVTGDRKWLEQVYPIIKQTIQDDCANVYDHKTGLVHGESSFLDWREQTYPAWMQPADIYNSAALGTNAVHYQANRVMEQMALALNLKAEAKKFNLIANQIKKAINKYLWQPDKGYYGQFLYGRNYLIRSPKSEALGEALCILFDVSGKDGQKEIIAKTPTMTYGIPCVYPQIPTMFNYHNNAVWPFVESYWVLAAAKAGNSESVMRGIAAIYRAAAFFLTNKENFVAASGDYNGTRVNSSNMLWSLSGNLSLVYKVLFGMEFQVDRLRFHPFVPQALAGNRTLKNFKYRSALLDIELDGFGDHVSGFYLDGKAYREPAVPADLSGKHQIRIVLSSNADETRSMPFFAPKETLQTPRVKRADGRLSWTFIDSASLYRVYRNGKLLLSTTDSSINLKTDGEYQVVATDREGYESFASEPEEILSPEKAFTIEVEKFVSPSSLPYINYTHTGFVEISKTKNRELSIPLHIQISGVYALSFRYANGNGYVYNNNKCAFRALKLDGRPIGTAVFPQRGPDQWSKWGYSNSIQTKLNKGDHLVTLQFTESNENMNLETNQALIDHMRAVLLDN